MKNTVVGLWRTSGMLRRVAWVAGAALILAGCATSPGGSGSLPAREMNAGASSSGVASGAAPLVGGEPSTRSGGAAGVETPAVSGRDWSESPSKRRPGLATSFGERRESRMNWTRFERREREPRFQAVLHYNDKAGLDVLMSRQPGTRESVSGWFDRDWDGFAYGVRGERGEWLPAWRSGPWTLVEGRSGERYSIVVVNRASVRREVVVSVDGLDVMDGRPASLKKRGYILNPGQEFSVEGFRTGPDTVAAFRFGTVGDSYSNLRHGTSRNVGVIGVAVFDEKDRDATLREDAEAFPGVWATPPRR